MKTAILTAAMMILMTVSFAKTTEKNVNPGSPEKVEFKASIAQPSNNVINFRVVNPESEKVVMKIYNEKKVKVFHRATKVSKAYSLKCDMSNLDSGLYTCVVLRNGQEEVRKQFVILN
jgi:hypothetical protein